MMNSVSDREKTFWEKEKMLVTSIFPSPTMLLRDLKNKKIGLCGKGLK